MRLIVARCDVSYSGPPANRLVAARPAEVVDAIVHRSPKERVLSQPTSLSSCWDEGRLADAHQRVQYTSS
jgi:hypothetical protein